MPPPLLGTPQWLPGGSTILGGLVCLVEVGWRSRAVATGRVRPFAVAEAAGRRPRAPGTPYGPPGPMRTIQPASGKPYISKVFFSTEL